MSNHDRSAPLTVREIAITVRDLDRQAAFYQDAIGLELLERGATEASLGAGGRRLLRLIGDAGARPEDPRSAGLFHMAFLLPSRADLGRWLLRATQAGVSLDGASDHGVSEALYLTDPEGNGIEVYVDRAAAEWPRDADGGLAMLTRRLDLNALAAAAGGAPQHGPMPAGSRLGHVHLRVGDVEAAKAYFVGALGFDWTQDYPGAAFFSTGGYHHHLAANVWRSRGAGRREAGRAGLSETVIEARDRAALDAVSARLGEAGMRVERTENGFRADDPWGLGMRFQLAA